MEIQELKDRLAEGKLTRRQLNGALAAVGLSLVTLPMPSRAAGEMTYFAWAGYDIPELMPGYVEKYGGLPNFGIFSDEEGALQKMRAGYKPDIAHLCSYLIGRYRDAGLFEPFDTSRLSNWPDLWPELTSLPIANEGGQTWFVPFDWGMASVLFRPDMAPEYVENQSWEILFDPKYEGQLAVYDAVDGAVIVAALVAGVENPFDPSDEDIAKVEAELERQRPLLRYYWTDQSNIEQSLASGEIVASYGWTSSLLTLQSQGIPIDYMTKPKEGVLTFNCGMMKHAEGPGDEQAAYDMVDAMLAPEAGVWMIENYGYGHSNMKTFEMVPPEKLAAVGLGDPKDVLTSGVFFDSIPAEKREKYIEMFEAVKLAGGG